MSRSGGTYTAPSNSFNPAVEGSEAEEGDWNETLDDLEAALTESVYTGGMGATDNRLVRTDGTDTKKVQGTGITVDDSDNVSGVGTLSSGTITTSGSLELGHASDTTLARSSAGNATIEGNLIYRAGGTDVPIADGGTGASTATAAFDALSPLTTQGDILYHNGTNNVRLGPGSAGNVLTSGGAGANPSWSSAGAGDVTAAAAMTDNTLVRGDGGAKGVQDTGITVDDTDNMAGVATLTLPNTGLHLLDTNASHDLIIAPGSDLTADHTLTVTTGDADRTVTLSGNPTLADWFDQSVKTTASPTFATPVVTSLEVGHATQNTLTGSGGDLSVEGNRLFRVGGTDVPIADGGTGASTATAAFDALSPLTTQGDVIYHNGTNNVRLGPGTSGQFLKTQGAGADPIWDTPAGAGDFVGPASSTDNAAVRFDSTTGKLGQNSALIIADTTGDLSRSGGGGIDIEGTTTNDDAAAGYIGEEISSTIVIGSAVSLTTTVTANITSISLTAGDWDIDTNAVTSVGGTLTYMESGWHTTSATLPTRGECKSMVWNGSTTGNQSLPSGTGRLSISGTTTVYLVCQCIFTSTCGGYGRIRARRVR